jgi:hypothetical protein
MLRNCPAKILFHDIAVPLTQKKTPSPPREKDGMRGSFKNIPAQTIGYYPLTLPSPGGRGCQVPDFNLMSDPSLTNDISQ